MIFIEFKEGQGLGNQLWLYFAAVSISKKLKTEVKIINYNQFVGKDFIKLNQSKKNVTTYDNIFHERFYYDHRIKHISHFYDERFYEINKNTLIEGYFQDERYFLNQKINFLKHVQITNPNFIKIKLDKKSCVLNIRGGEYKRHKDFILPKKYWLNSIEIMKKRGIEKFIIVTDDKKYCDILFPKYEVVFGSIKECFLYLLTAKNIIVSNSTFSYFPIKMQKNNPNVIAPAYWGRYNDKQKIWASPSNFYFDWNWIDDSGKILDNNKLKKKINDLEKHYHSNYYLLTDINLFDHEGIRKYFPKKLRNLLKKILSFVFPLKFG